MSATFDTWSSQAGYEAYNMTRHSDDGTMDPRPFRYTKKSLVKVTVGPTAEEFFVHHELLQLSSPYFAARLRECWQPPSNPLTPSTSSSGSTSSLSEFKPMHSYSLSLPQISTQHWEIIVDYLYTSQLPDQLNELKKEQLLDLSLVILPLYHVADTLILTKLQNKLADCLISNLKRLDFTCDITDCCQAAEFNLTHLPIYRFLLASCAHNVVMRHGDDAKIKRHVDKARAFPDVMCDILFEINRFCRDSLHERRDPRDEPLEKWHVKGIERRNDWDRDIGIFEKTGSTEEEREKARQEREQRAAAQKLEEGLLDEEEERLAALANDPAAAAAAAAAAEGDTDVLDDDGAIDLALGLTPPVNTAMWNTEVAVA